MKLANQYLSKNFTLREFITSATAARHGLDNTPTHDQIQNMERLCRETLQPARDELNQVVTVSGGFRSKRLNDMIGGAQPSDHTDGNAADIQAFDTARLFHIIRKQNNFDQLIWEFGNSQEPDWVHVSNRGKDRNRKQILIAYKNAAGATKYKQWRA